VSRPGSAAEEAAEAFLRRKGYRILRRNYRCPAGEIDIVAREKKAFCFVEVKSRNSDACGSPAEAVTPEKRRRLCRVAAWYLSESGYEDAISRFDVVAVMYEGAGPEIELYKDAFECEER
jgi:putative endonuclease